MKWLQGLAGEIAVSVTDGGVWLAIGKGLLLYAACLGFGIWAARSARILERDAPAGETLGVGLAVGSIVLASWWAALLSRGQSAFTPVAIGFAVALALSVARGRSHETGAVASAAEGAPEKDTPGFPRWLPAVVAGAVFIVVVAHLYGSTMVLAPRDGVQPIEFMDTAFYSVLGEDVATTGLESTYTPAGFDAIPGLPPQNWYHWGEIWLASAAIRLLDVAPIMARHFVVLPMLLLAAAALTGALVRRSNGTRSTGAFVVGAVACLALAPVPWFPGPFFGNWAVGMIFGISVYGLAAVVALLIACVLVVPRVRPESWTGAVFVGSLIASLVPAHVIIAALAMVAAGTIFVARAIQWLRTDRQIAIVSVPWRRTIVCASVGLMFSTGYGFLTGHSLGGTATSASVAPFNATWWDTLVTIALGGGALYSVVAAWILARRERSDQALVYVVAGTVLVAGAITWGARLGDFNMFHVFFASLAVFLTPAAAVAIWLIWRRMRLARRSLVAIVLAVAVVLQLEFGAVQSVLRLQRFGPGNYEPVPLELLTAIRALPANAKLAYSCATGEEVSYWDARLLAIGAHADRRIVPMCFETDSFASMVGGHPPPDEMSPLFATAPQLAVYPDAASRPSSEAMLAFLRAHGIGYIYADDAHPNRLVADATEIAASGQFRLLRVP